MAQTKRKKRGKHRGNAIGQVEARGRAGSKPAGPPSKNGRSLSSGTSGGRKPVALKPPSWQSAAMKAAFGCVILFVFFKFLSKNSSTGGAISFSLFAFVLYTPVMYYTDRMIYNRKLKAQKR
jgi:hypothetical protein